MRSAGTMPTSVGRSGSVSSHPARVQKFVKPSWSLSKSDAAQRAEIPTKAGSFRLRGAVGGARKGESVSTRSRSAGTRRTTSADASSPAR